MKLECQKIVADICTSRFIEASAFTFSYTKAKSDKTFKESIDIPDDLFFLRGNGLNPANIFDDENLVKETIRSETNKRFTK